MIPVPFLVALLASGAALAGLGGAVYAGAFRAPEHVKGWEADREKRASSLLVLLGAILILGALLGVGVVNPTALAWGGPW